MSLLTVNQLTNLANTVTVDVANLVAKDASGYATATTAPNADSSTKLATTAFVHSLVDAVGSTFAVKTAAYAAVAGDNILANTSGGSFNITLPGSPATGAKVTVADDAGTWASYNLTLSRNGQTIAGSATDLVMDVNGASVDLIYDGSTWRVYAQSAQSIATATGGGGDQVFYENSPNVVNSYSITSGKNAMAVGPLNISSGKSITVGSGQKLVVL
jgi:hypothetical protein